MTPDEKRNKPAIEIPVKNVKIHQPKSPVTRKFSPSDEIYVRKVTGKYHTLRRRMNLFFLALFAILPWLQYNGRQALLFDLGEQRFTMWALTLWPQDLTLLAFIFILGAFLLFFVTTFLGRVWCGYLCPQTVWTFIFIWFEEKIEGTANQRKKLNTQPMSFNKFWRKALKHTAWVAFSLATALSFVGYFTPMHLLVLDFFTLNTSFAVFATVIFFTFCTYGNAGWMREIMCLHMCPYARFQSAMFDKDTLTVSYDAERGEGRGARGRKQDHKAMGLGDCIDCNLCVQVCPTGIDIRNGLQYECINCASCIDACNGVMDKMGYERGLVRYSTEHELHGKKTIWLRSKLVGYAVILLTMSALLILEVVNRVPMSLEIIRDRTELAKETNEGLIENVYTLKILNKSQMEHTYLLSVRGIENISWNGPQTVTVEPGKVAIVPISLAVDPYDLQGYLTDIQFVIEEEGSDGGSEIQHDSKFFNKR